MLREESKRDTTLRLIMENTAVENAEKLAMVVCYLLEIAASQRRLTQKLDEYLAARGGAKKGNDEH